MPSIPPFIRYYIRNADNCVEINIGERRGFTDYIDFLKKEDFPNNVNVIYGRDNANRFFISVLYKIITLDKLDNDNDNDPYIQNYYIMTLFQRYTNEPYFIVSCGGTFVNTNDVKTHTFNNINNRPLPDQFALFFALINDGEFVISDNIHFFIKTYNVILGNKKKYQYKLFY